MDKIINKGLFFAKIIILLVAFTVTLYILFIRMDTYELSALSLFPIFIPSLFLLITFIFGLFLNIGKNNMFFNIVCITVLLAILVIDYRTIYDTNIISNTKINLHYFDLSINKIEIMLYLTFISNILLIIYEKKNKIHS